MLELSNKIILVTGASGGIGRAIAITCSRLGANLVITGRDQTRLNETLNLLQGSGHFKFCGDLLDETFVESLATKTTELNGIVHCAGIIYPLPVKFIKKKHIDEVFNANYNSAVLLTSLLLKNSRIKKNASLVFISSVSSKHPYFGGALYISSKAALEAYAMGLALELSGSKTRVNILSPGLVKTQILIETLASSSSEKALEHEKNYPLGFGEPDDVAGITAFLLSDLAKWITGQNIVLDGGLTLGGQHG